MNSIDDLLRNVKSIAEGVVERAFEKKVAELAGEKSECYSIDVGRVVAAFGVPIYYEALNKDLAGCFIMDKGRVRLL